MKKTLDEPQYQLVELMKGELGLMDHTARYMAEDPMGLGLIISEKQRIALKESHDKVLHFFEVADKRGLLTKGKDRDWLLRRAFELPGGGVVDPGEN